MAEVEVEKLEQIPTQTATRFKVVKGVNEADFIQAQITWNACEVAGVDLNAVPEGLHNGHGYKLTTLAVHAPFRQRPSQTWLGQDPNLIGASLYTSNCLAHYSYALQNTLPAPATASETSGHYYSSLSLLNPGEVSQPQAAVEVIAVVKADPVKLAGR